MVLADTWIRTLAGEGLVEPYREDQLQPASYDVRLGDEFLVFEPHDEYVVDLNDPQITTKLVRSQGFVLHPGEFVLARTEERVSVPSDLVGRVEGKSSMGRVGLQVHVTAGYLDPGFSGVITLEMANLLRVPIVLRPSVRVAQLSFTRLTEPCERPYQGRYQGAEGVEAAKPERAVT